MLTISPIKSSAGASTYFAKEDNYYLSEVDAREHSMWLGIGADKLELSNKKVLKDNLQNAFEGRLPNGVTIESPKDNSVKHRPGFDLCFHAPKSVSILALDGGDERFYKAHLEAVKETLKVIEGDCAQARVYKNKATGFENTKNLTIALVRHTASRTLDPHLHHHALVMNATERQDKTWRALASSMKNKASQGFFEQIYHNQIYYGLIYRNSLANKVLKLGCEIEIVGKHMMWEIKGVPKEAREAMSKRRKEIEGLLSKLNYHSFKAADIVAYDSRENKPKNIKLEEMKQTWKEELAKAGFSSKEFLASLPPFPSLSFLTELEKNKDKSLTENPEKQENQKIQEIQKTQKSGNINLAIDTVKDATWYLSQYKLKLEYKRIISQAMEFAIGKMTHRDIVLATDKLINDGFLIPLDKSDTIFVTKELIETEKTIMELVDNSKNKWTDFAPKYNSANTNFIASLAPVASDASLASDEIKKYALDILQSKHRVCLVDSSKSDNKELIAGILELAESSGKTVRVLSPNRLIANDINENITRSKPDNLWQWLLSLGRPEVGESVAGFMHKYKEEVDLPSFLSFLLRFKHRKDVVVVSNTEALGCNDTKTLLELTEKSNAKVILLRDITDKRNFGAGNLIDTLKQAGIERFKTPELEQVPTPTTSNISGIIPELKIVKDNKKRTLQLAKEYAFLEENKEDKKKQNNKNTIILVGSKEQLKATNEAIREELRQQGKISEVEYSIPVLNPIYMSKPEAILAHKYQQNMVIRFYGSVPDDWNVAYCNRESNTLKLIKGNRIIVWNPKKQQDRFKMVKYGIFKKDTLRIAKGDKLIATGNMYDLGIKNGTKFTVGETSGEKNGGKNGSSIELLCDTERANNAKASKTIRVSLDKLKNSHFQYDYATTLNKSSKKPTANIIADFKAYLLDKPLIDELNRRAKKTLTIFTNDGEVAKKRFGHAPVKITATEMLLGTNEIASNTEDTINTVKKTLSDKTISEIKSELEKAIGVLRDQYAFRSQDERKAVAFAIEKITSRNAGFDYRDLGKEALEYALEELISKQNKAVTLEDIKRAIEEKRAAGELVIGKDFGDGVKWTTKEALELEQSIIDNLKKGVNKLAPLVDPKHLKIPTETEKINLTKDQKNAIALIASTKDQYVIVQGYSGTGKTAMFAEVHKILKEENNKNNNKNNDVNNNENNNKKEKIKVLGLAPTHKAVRELKAIGIKAQTLQSFLTAQKIQKNQLDIGSNTSKDTKINILDNKLIILDETSMVPDKDLFQFTEIVNSSKAHVVYGGDTDQHLPIGSGKPIENAQKSNVLKIAYLKEIVRQKNPNIKEAVISTINKNYAHALDKIEQDNPQNYIERIDPDTFYGGNRENGENIKKSHTDRALLVASSTKTVANPEESSFIDPKSDLYKSEADLDFEFFKNLQKSIIEIDNNELKSEEKTLERMVAEDFLTRTPEVRDKTVVIVHANDDRKVITEYIRSGLKKQGVIEKTGIRVNCLTDKGFTSAEHKSLKSYNRGDVVKLANKYYNIAEVDLEAKSLLLKDGAGKTRYFYPEKEVDKYNMELYSHTKEELAIGDVIRLTKTDKRRGLFANFEYRVKEINNKQAILEFKDKKDKETSQITLNHRKLKDSHWDYAQTVTGYGVQGASKDYAIDFEVSYRKFLANVRSFYIGISRAIKHLTIYTDNKAKFLKQLLRNPGNKYSALEVVGELQEKETPNTEKDTQDIEKIKKIKKIEKQINAEFYNIKEIKLSLKNQAEVVVKNLLGEPNNKLSSSMEWRYGNKGSLVINIASNKRGLWYNFETGESGGLLGLLQKELGLNFPEVLKYASGRFGGLQNHTLPPKINKDQSDSKNQNDQKNQFGAYGYNKNTRISLEADEKHKKTEKSKTSEYAQKLAKESLPIAGTIVEKYLKEHRSIKNIDTEDIRYHPRVFTDKNEKNEKQKYMPAMLSIGRDKDGNIQCVQATYLNSKTANKADLAIKKRTYASPSGALIFLKKHKDGDKDVINHKNKISFIAEGTETGLSIKDAMGNTKNNEVVVTLGKSNFANIDPKSVGNKVIFCLDNDGPKTFADTSIHKAAERLISFGKEVFIAIPKTSDKNVKVDFNDIAKTGGIGEVRNMLENTISYKEWVNVRGIDINFDIVEKVMRPKNIYLKSSDLLPQKPDINLNFAAKLIDSDKSSFGKYLDTYDQMQQNLSKQRVIDIPKVNVPNIQKDLSKVEKEIY